MEITAYNVIHGSFDFVVSQVNKAIHEGWQPIGNVGTQDGNIFHQAVVMVKRPSPVPPDSSLSLSSHQRDVLLGMVQ